jgi:hypothetical protein
MQRINELIPPLPVVRERYAANLREATMLRRLMRLAQAVAREEKEHRRIFSSRPDGRATASK